MNKIIIFLFVITVSYLLINNQEEIVLIPNDAIRMRIIANSDEVEDQIEKNNVKEKLENIILSINHNNINDTREEINKVIPTIEETLKDLNLSYDINYGDNYFPEKEYKGVLYQEGHYESLVITLGEGEGNNWWCVVFPPLCLIEANEEEIDNIEYSFYIKNIIDQYN